MFVMCMGHWSGQFVYPKNSSVTDPRVRSQKSNGAPEVSVSTNLGFGRGGVTIPPRNESPLAWCAGARDASANTRPKKRVLISSSSSMDDHGPDHAELVVDSTDVVERAGNRERHAEAGDVGIRLRQVRAILRGRRQEPRRHVVRRRSDGRFARAV